MPTPPTNLSAAFVIATLVPLLIGIVNQMVQSKTIFGQWPLPATVLPLLTVVGSFLTGVGSYIASQSPFVLNSVSIFMMFVSGIYGLFLGQLPGTVRHHFGAAIHVLRPAPANDNAASKKSDPNAKTEPPPPPSAAAA